MRTGITRKRSEGPATPSVLVVADNESIRSLVTEILQEHEYKVYVSASIEQTLRQVRRRNIGLVVLNLETLEQGKSITRELHRWPKLPILALAGASGSCPAKCAEMLGVQAVIKKPFSCETLLGRVQGLMASSRAAGAS